MEKKSTSISLFALIGWIFEDMVKDFFQLLWPGL